MSFKTADLCDQYNEAIHIAKPLFADFGGRSKFCGVINTVKCHEDNSFVRAELETDGDGKVLVIDGGGSLRCALLGDQLADLAMKNHWAGIVIYGCIRDSADIANIKIGVKALATHPRKSVKRNHGERNIKVNFANVDFEPGAYIYCDEDGIITSAKPLQD